MSSLRIIGGLFKGRNLKTPSRPLTKPTTSILRKAVFDICQGSIQGSYFLDLFACSGAMGIEAISRGATFATFIESDRKTVQTLTENIELLSLQAQSRVICADVFTAIHKLSSSHPYQIVYIDPPYSLAKDPKMLALLQFLDTGPLLDTPCSLFIEEGSPGFLALASHPFSRLRYKNTRRFGSTLLHELYID